MRLSCLGIYLSYKRLGTNKIYTHHMILYTIKKDDNYKQIILY